jgi:hypothetical protein
MNKRKFKHWDNKLLFNTLQKALQIKDKIEAQCYEKQLNPYDLPMSMLPSSVLYDMTACYEAMYDKLLDEELIICGYPRSSPTYH